MKDTSDNNIITHKFIQIFFQKRNKFKFLLKLIFAQEKADQFNLCRYNVFQDTGQTNR